MAEEKKASGIILKKLPYGDTDWILTFLLDDGSRFTAFAKSARHSTKRFEGGLDLFNQYNFIYKDSAHSQLPSLTSAELVLGMEGTRKDLLKFATTCYFAEVITEFLQENEKSPPLYTVFLSFLKSLNTVSHIPKSIIPMMEHEFLLQFGFNPTLNHCLKCKETLHPNAKYFFDGLLGGIVCDACDEEGAHFLNLNQNSFTSSINKNTREFYPLSYSALSKILKRHTDLLTSWDLDSWNPDEVTQVRRAFEYFLQYTAGKPFKSLKFLTNLLA